MGLDIRAYRKISKIDAVFNADGEPINPETRKPLCWNEYAQFHVNHDFPGREGDIENRSVYAFQDEFGFRAGSYSGYNSWRRSLARLAGYTPGDAWVGKCVGMPFVELVNFSDCEGVIGAQVSAKLAADFAEFDERAKVFENEYFYEKYCDWRHAFEMAADGGAVAFW